MNFTHETIVVPNATGAYMLTAWDQDDGSGQVFFTKAHIVAWRINDQDAEPILAYGGQLEGSNHVESVIVNNDAVTQACHRGCTYDNLESFIRSVCTRIVRNGG